MFLWIALGMTALIVYGSWVPFRLRPIPVSEGIAAFFHGVRTLGERPSRVDFSTNVLLFLPTSFAWMGVLSGGRRSVLPVAAIAAIAAAVLAICMATGLVVELGQVWIADRIPSPYDLLAHLIGTTAGIGLWLGLGRQVARWVARFRAETAPNARMDALLTLYLVGLVIYSVLPLDLTLHPAELVQKFRRGRIDLVPFRGWSFRFAYVSGLLLDVVLFVPVGAWCYRRFAGRAGDRSAWWYSVWIGVWIAVGLECVQLLVMSRFTDATDVVTGAAGVALGAAWVHWLTDRGRAARPVRLTVPWWSLTALVAFLLVLYYCWPLELAPRGAAIRSRLVELVCGVPFGSLNAPSQLETLSNFLEKVLLFALWGALAARAVAAVGLGTWPRRVAVVAAGAGLGLAIEVLQTALPARTPDLGDALLAAVGTLLGVWIVERLGGVSWS